MGMFDEPYVCETCGKKCTGLPFWTICTECSRAAYEKRMAEIRRRSAYTVSSIGGMCPTKAEGRTVGGRPYYFRARHGDWTLEVGHLNFPTDYGSWPFVRGDWNAFLVASGDDPTHGGMSDAEVLAILDEHLAGR